MEHKPDQVTPVLGTAACPLPRGASLLPVVLPALLPSLCLSHPAVTLDPSEHPVSVLSLCLDPRRPAGHVAVPSPPPHPRIRVLLVCPPVSPSLATMLKGISLYHSHTRTPALPAFPHSAVPFQMCSDPIEACLSPSPEPGHPEAGTFPVVPTAGSLLPLTVPGTHQILMVEQMNKEKETEGERGGNLGCSGQAPWRQPEQGRTLKVVRNREGSDQDPEGRPGQEAPAEEPWGHGVCWRAGLQH